MREQAGHISPPIGMLVWHAMNDEIKPLHCQGPASAVLSPADAAPFWTSWMVQQRHFWKRWRAASGCA
jgi:hypothetical protein